MCRADDTRRLPPSLCFLLYFLAFPHPFRAGTVHQQVSPCNPRLGKSSLLLPLGLGTLNCGSAMGERCAGSLLVLPAVQFHLQFRLCRVSDNTRPLLCSLPTKSLEPSYVRYSTSHICVMSDFRQPSRRELHSSG